MTNEKSVTVITSFKISEEENELLKIILEKEGFKKGRFIAKALSTYLLKFSN